jgi:hypothetical protein
MTKGFLAAAFTLFTIAVLAPASALADQWGKPINTPERFVVLSSYNNEAVLDRETGLVWEQSPEITVHPWQVTQPLCNQKPVGSRRGWRLPTVQELLSLSDPTVPRPGPTLPTGHPFSNVQSSPYWTASSSTLGTSIAWGVNFTTGDPFSSAKSNEFLIWCVRGGQGVDPQ